MQAARRRARRAVVPFEPCPGGDRFDYADSFTVVQPAEDGRSAVELLRAGIEGAPSVLRAVIVVAHRRVLGFRLRMDDRRDSVLGWKIARSDMAEAALQAESPMMRGLIVLRRDPERRLTLSTYLRFRRPTLARIVWFVVGPLHRRIAPYLLARAVRPS